jgi:predicted Zn-dependent protease
MAILDQVRARLTEAIKAKSDDKDVYRLLMAKCQTDGAKTDDEAITCVQCVINGNLKAIEQTQRKRQRPNMVLPPTVFSKLEAENRGVGDVPAPIP